MTLSRDILKEPIVCYEGAEAFLTSLRYQLGILLKSLQHIVTFCPFFAP